MRIVRSFLDGEYGQLHLRAVQPDTVVHPPLLCLHQISKSGREFARFMEIAGRDRMVIAPDYPGYGESALPPAESSVRIEDYARVMWQVADQVSGNSQIDLFGNHTGSLVAAEMARTRPGTVRKVAMISAPIMTRDEIARMREYFLPIPIDEAGTRFTTMWSRILEHRSEGFTLEMMAESFAENLRAGDAYEWGHRAAFDYCEAFPEIIAGLRNKVIVLNPRDLLHEMTTRAAPLLTNGRVIDCPEWGQEVLNVHPAALAEKLLSEFEGWPARTD